MATSRWGASAASPVRRLVDDGVMTGKPRTSGATHRRSSDSQAGDGREGTTATEALRILLPLLAVAVAISVVHYTDNALNYDAYPQPTTGPAPSQGLIAGAWFGFTALAAAGYVLLRRGRVKAAALCLALYSGSGLVGLGHYTVPGATSMPVWRQAHIVADIACGVAVFAFALWLARRPPDRPASDSRARGAKAAARPGAQAARERTGR